MPERGFQTEIWTSNIWFQGLSRNQRYLFWYIGWNNHCNQAGLYYITLKSISDETLFSKDELPELLSSLSPEVMWYPDHNLIWDKGFIKRNSHSPKFLIAAAKSLSTIEQEEIVTELIEYNSVKYRISIPYVYPTDRVPILTRASKSKPISKSEAESPEGKGVVKGKGERIRRSRQEAEETLCGGDSNEVIARKFAGGPELPADDLAIISVWCSVKGFKMTPTDASALVASLRTEFADLDLLAESKAWSARKISDPLKPSSRSSQQIWNWMRLARQFAEERRAHAYGSTTKESGSRGFSAAGADRRHTKAPTDADYRRSLPTRRQLPSE